jgi:putative ABC transport system permease protein
MSDWKDEVRVSLAGLELEPAREAEIVEELAQHLDERFGDLVARGVAPEEARRMLIGELRGGGLAAELARVAPRARPAIAPGEERRGILLSGVLGDPKYAARQLRLNPGFAAVAVLSLALGTGANTAIFQILDAVRLRALPVSRPQELAGVKIAGKVSRTGWFSGRSPDLTNAVWEALRDRQQAFSQIAAWGTDRLDLSKGGEARYADTLFVSGSFFEALGVRPALGRLLTPADDQHGCGSAGVVLSDAFFRRELGGDPSILGRTVSLEGHPFEVIGVTPPSFFGVEVGRRFDVALPICADVLIYVETQRSTSPSAWWLGSIGRLAPGWTVERASAHLAGISPGIFQDTLPPRYDAVDAKGYLAFRLGATPAASGVSALRRRYESPLVLLMAIAGLVLLIACANLANLMLARASARQKEMAVRLALGASRGRLVRQLMAESLLVACLGAACGAALAQALSRLLVAFLSTQQAPLFVDLAPGGRVLGFTLALAFATCILFGLTPAIQAARIAPGEALKANARGISGGRGRFGMRRALVVSQVALSLVLLVGALLFVRTLRNLSTLDAGFRRENIVVAEIDLTRAKLPAERRAFAKKELLDRIRAIPGVSSAATVAVVPVSGNGWNETLRLPSSGTKGEVANFNRVSPGYFETMGTPFLGGRDFDGRDVPGGPKVAIVTQTFVKKFLTGGNPIGRTFAQAGEAGKPDLVYEVVGVVKDAKYIDLREEFTPIVFLSEAQDEELRPDLRVVVRSELPPAGVIASVKRTLSEASPAAVLVFSKLETTIKEALLRERLMATLSGFFGVLAALLAMVGLYGVISYMVARRRNEIGVRIALGAERRDIVKLVMSEAARLLGIGLVAGTVLALAAATTARALLYGLTPGDPVTVAGAVFVLAAVAALASLLPARRAAGFDPVRALRDE